MRTAVSEFINSNTQTLALNGLVKFNNNTYPTDVYQYNSDGSISILKPGVYEVLANFTILATAEGDVQLSMLQGGSVAPGSVVTESLAAIGDFANVSIMNVVKVNCAQCGNAAKISFTTNVATSLSDAICIIKRFG